MPELVFCFDRMLAVRKGVHRLGADEMNFINDRELARRFKEDAVPSRERLYYVLFAMAIVYILLLTDYFGEFSAETNRWDIASVILQIFITFFGTIFVYGTNSNGDNREFIERYACLIFPIFVQYTLIEMILFIIFGIIVYGGAFDVDDRYIDIYISFAAFIIIAILDIYFFWRLNGAIKIASH